MDVHRVLPDFLNDAVHTREDWSVLGQIQGFWLIRYAAELWKSREIANGQFQLGIGRTPGSD